MGHPVGASSWKKYNLLSEYTTCEKKDPPTNKIANFDKNPPFHF